MFANQDYHQLKSIILNKRQEWMPGLDAAQGKPN